jgi:hypothetical protein
MGKESTQFQDYQLHRDDPNYQGLEMVQRRFLKAFYRDLVYDQILQVDPLDQKNLDLFEVEEDIDDIREATMPKIKGVPLPAPSTQTIANAPTLPPALPIDMTKAPATLAPKQNPMGTVLGHPQASATADAPSADAKTPQ